MTDYREEFPGLTYAISPYFHQDWASEYRWNGGISWETVVKQFMTENAPVKTEQAIKDLEKFLFLPLSDDEVNDVVKYDFTTSGFLPLKTGRAFLERVLEILKEPRPNQPPLIRK